jgi:hypothetical protein
MAKLAHELFMSASEVHAASQRLKASGFIRKNILCEHIIISAKYKKRSLILIPNIEAMEEFLIHGLKYVFPAEEGKEMRGIPTAHSASPLSELIVADERDMYVWAYEFGNVRGKSISPLYSSVPRAAEVDKELYELLVLIDGIRIGRTREVSTSINELTKRLKAGSERFKNVC